MRTKKRVQLLGCQLLGLVLLDFTGRDEAEVSVQRSPRHRGPARAERTLRQCGAATWDGMSYLAQRYQFWSEGPCELYCALQEAAAVWLSSLAHKNRSGGSDHERTPGFGRTNTQTLADGIREIPRPSPTPRQRQQADAI